MPRRVEYNGRIHEFPDDATDQEIQQSLASEPAPTQEPTMLEAVVEGTGNFLRGVGASIWSVPAGAAKLAGMESQTLNQLATPPETTAGKAGNFLGQGAQFLVPSAGAARGAALLANPVARGAVRAGLEAVGAGSLAGVQSGGDLETMRNAAIAGGGLSAAGSAAGTLAPRLAEKAIEQYGRVLNPTKIKTKAVAREIIPELIQRRESAISMPRMLARVEDRLRVLGGQIDQAWDVMEQQGVMADIAPMIRRMGDVAQQHYFVENATGQLVPLRGPAEQGMKAIQNIAENLFEASTVNPITGAREIPTRALREFRQYWDEIADKSGAFHKKYRDLAEWATGRAHQYAGNAVRAELAAARPDLAALNKEFSFWQKTADVVDETIQRRVGQQKPLSRRLAQITGALAGKDGLTSLLGAYAMDQFQGLVSSPGWGTVSAVTKDRLANALAQGNKSQSMFYLNQALRSVGMAAITGQSERGAKTLAPSSAR